MRRLLALLLLGLFLAGSAFANTISITVPWTQVRRTPSMDGRAVDIAYGNDVFTVLEIKDGFAKIRTHRKIVGWVVLNDVDQQAGGEAPPAEQPAPAGKKPELQKAAASAGAGAAAGKDPRATALSNAISLRKVGYREQAREKFTDLILSEPGSPESYEATRQMLNFYLVGYLPPLQKNGITPEGQKALGPVSADVLLQEAVALQGEVHFPQSARVYQYLLERDPENGRAFLGLLDTLQHAMTDAAKASQEVELAKAVATFRKFFPDNALPDAVQQHLSAAKKG